MKREPITLGTLEGTMLILVAGITPVFLSIWSQIIEQAATAAWLTPMITGSCILMLLYAIFYVMSKIPGDLMTVAETLLGKAGGHLITAFLGLSFMANATLELRQYAENTLLTVVPALDITVAMFWFAGLAAVAAHIGIQPLARATGIFIPLGLIGFALILVALLRRFDIYNLMPWLGSGLPVVAAGVGSTGLFLSSLILPILRPAFRDLESLRKAALIGIVLGTAVRTLTLFIYVGVFSVAVGREKTLPFFELVRLVFVNRFIQRIESFFILVWTFYGMTIIAFNLFLAAYLFTRLFALPSLRPLLFPLAVTAIHLAMLIPDQTTTVELTLLLQGKVQTFGAFAIPAALLTASWLYDRRRQPHAT